MSSLGTTANAILTKLFANGFAGGYEVAVDATVIDKTAGPYNPATGANDLNNPTGVAVKVIITDWRAHERTALPSYQEGDLKMMLLLTSTVTGLDIEDQVQVGSVKYGVVWASNKFIDGAAKLQVLQVRA